MVESFRPTDVAPASDRAAQNRYGFIDAIRGIAAIAVVIEHAIESYYGQGVAETQMFSFGQFGVAAFLFVSGFVVPVSLERSASAVKFWIGRFFRLYPLYWFTLIVVAPLALATYVQGQEGFNPHEPVHWLGNVTMLQQFIGIPHAVGAFWTLTIEMALYVSFTILFWTGRLSKSWQNAWWIISLSTLLAIVIPFVIHRRLPGGSSGAYIFYFMTAFVGTVGYRWHTGKIGTKRFAILMATAAAVGAGIAYALYERFRSDKVPMSFTCAVVTWMVAYAFLVVMLWHRNRSTPKPLLWAGKVSYSIYLLHFLPIYLMPKSLPFWAYTTGIVASVLALSSVTYLAIEAPSDKLGKRLQART